jgi:5-methylcytosine-specific restriction endonuclease McrA
VSARRGTSNGNQAGSSYDRRARKLWLLSAYGDGELTVCYRCNVPLLYEDLTSDRIVPGCLGGTYQRSNIRPCCGPCNSDTGGHLSTDFGKELHQNGKCV